jgi:hypothetical protein
MFVNKTNRTGDKLTALESRIIELRERIIDREKSIAEKREMMGRILAELALQETTEYQENLKSCKKSIAAQEDTIAEAHAMLLAAETERTRLLEEMALAEVREAPGKLEELAKNFNLVLDEGLALLEGVEVLHRKLQSMQSQWHNILNKRSNSLSVMGRREGLVLQEGLGRLSQVGSPFGQSFTIPSEVQDFIAQLKQYRGTLKNFENFKAQNPKFDEDVKRTQKRDAENAGVYAGRWQ